ncbi:MAG TPA: hypothetical protein VMZ53_33690, partial [Kofleriaceae bacterium]|nr:hypothetical protein [Kofleriaceae bacterium]
FTVAAVEHRSVAAALDELPLYIQRGAIVPMLRDTIDTLAPATVSGIESYANDPGLLVVRIAPGPHSAFTLFDETKIEQQLEAGVTTVDYTPGKTFVGGALLESIATDAPAAVTTVSGALTQRASYAALQAAADGWFYDATATGGTLWIKLAGAATVTVR